MQYTKLDIYTFFAEPFMQDLLVAELAEIGFESFETEQQPLRAYIQTPLFYEHELVKVLSEFMFEGIDSWTISQCEDKDWNAEWEKNFFQPIVIGNQCVIHSSFAHDIPSCAYDIVIDPKMAFGTGHHQTTSMMLEAILNLPIENKDALDMGCGTAVLAILASMRGAKSILAIDIDDWCTRNAEENLQVNNISNVEVLLGDASLLSNRHFDVILANINRNILLGDMERYVSCLNKGGYLLLSGFYEADADMLIAKANQLHLSLYSQHTKDDWCQLTFQL